jgi:GNAT superfamily N-acetyltransferase
MTEYGIRPCTPEDAAVVARHRVEMFRDMGEVPTQKLALELLDRSTAALAAALADGTYVGWLAVEAAGKVIAGAGAHIKPQLPRISPGRTHIESGPLPLVVNVYTEREYRGQGIARAIMRVLMDWAMSKGTDRIVLHASNQGRPLYTSLGFHPTNEMRWSRPELKA